MSDDLRDRLVDLAEEATPELSDAARRRVIETMGREGPHVVEGALRRRRAVAFGGVALLAAAALLSFLVADPFAAPPETVADTTRACVSWSAAPTRLEDGRFDLGPRGLVTLDGEATVGAPDSCITEVVLIEGRVDVRADDLGGGVLRVEAGPVRVEVRGTQFSVTKRATEVTVAVREGHVVVSTAGDREIHLHDGERWSLDPQREGSVRRGAAPEARRRRAGGDAEQRTEPGVRLGAEEGAGDGHEDGVGGEDRALERNTDRRPRPETPDAVLARAEALWRDRDLPTARRLFRQVGHGDGAVAEAAWVRLSRLELRGGAPREALAALDSRARRFPSGRLEPEALYLEADAHRRLGDEESRARAVDALRSRYPDSPQARAVESGARVGAE